MFATALRLPLLALALLIAGCSSTPRVPEEMKPSLRTLQSDLNAGEAALERTVNALRDLLNSEKDVPGALRRYSDELAQLTAVVERAKGSVPSTNPEIGFLGRWKADIDAMQDSAMRSAAQDRREETIRSLETLERRMDELRVAFRPYYTRLQEVQTYLRNDPTPAGLRGIKDSIVKVVRDKGGVTSRVDAVQSQINKLLK